MTGPEHYQKAEALLEQLRKAQASMTSVSPEKTAAVTAEAQVHATLALAAATALVDETPRSDSMSEYRAWHEVAGSEYRAAV